MQLTPLRLAGWLAAAVAIGIGAFLVGQGGGSGSQSRSPTAADAPRQMTLPRLTGVAPLPSMKAPPHHRPKQAEAEPVTEESTGGEEPAEVETYEAPVEETAPPAEESSGASTEATAPPPAAEPSEPTESGPSGGGEELVPEG